MFESAEILPWKNTKWSFGFLQIETYIIKSSFGGMRNDILQSVEVL